eukprot:1330603-Amorphochlora_amoeboformis.AAC.1
MFMNFTPVFERYEGRGVDLVMPKLIYVALNLAGFVSHSTQLESLSVLKFVNLVLNPVRFALVCWKLNSMGLLPSAWELAAEPKLRV